MAKRPTTVEELERKQRLALVQTALAKQKAGQTLSAKELAAWKRWEQEQDQERGGRYVTAVPKKTYLIWSGRPTKILHDQADLYGIPLRGATIDVPEVVAWLHDFLAKWKHDLAPLVKGTRGDSDHPPGLEEQLLREQVQLYRGKNQMLERDLAARDANLLPRAEVHTLLLRAAKILRAAGERLYRSCGDQAGDILKAAIDDFEATIVAELADDKRPANDALMSE